MDSEITEYDIWLSEHDMDHLKDGQPVFKGVEDDILLIIRARLE